MDHVDIAWYVGDTRSTYFDIEVSSDTVIWTMVFSGQSSGQTLQFERYDFPATAGRYLRIVGHGNSLLTGWISITEVTISQAAASVATASLPVSSVVASASDSTVPQNTRDDNLATRWSAQGDGQWIRYDLGGLAAVEYVDIAWYLGDTRSAYFDIQVRYCYLDDCFFRTQQWANAPARALPIPDDRGPLRPHRGSREQHERLEQHYGRSHLRYAPPHLARRLSRGERE